LSWLALLWVGGHGLKFSYPLALLLDDPVGFADHPVVLLDRDYIVPSGFEGSARAARDMATRFAVVIGDVAADAFSEVAPGHLLCFLRSWLGRGHGFVPIVV
jgi:hypothetical protein